MAESPAREEIARRYGFNSFSELVGISAPLPRQPEDEVQSYVAKCPNGRWFVWEDAPAFRVVGIRQDRAKVMLLCSASEEAAKQVRKMIADDSNYERVEIERENNQ